MQSCGGLVDSHRHVPTDGAADAIEGIARERSFVFATGSASDWAIVDAVHQHRSEDDVMCRFPVGFGFHPWFLSEAEGLESGGTSWIDGLRAKLLERPTAFVGEIGLDKLRGPPMEIQLAAMAAQVDVAVELRRPVSVHCVRAWGPMLTFLTKRSADALPPAFIFHGFSGSPDFVQSLMKMGKRKASRFYFGVAATTTGRLKDCEKVLSAIPPCRLLLESDSHDTAEAQRVLAESVDAFNSFVPDFASCTTANALAVMSPDTWS